MEPSSRPADGGISSTACSATRALEVTEAAKLLAGADHYRAYVGPPNRYDLISSSQFALLFTLGLREHHRVLDFGCGSLWLGRLLVPFLRPERYFGIDPTSWLIDEAIEKELGRDAIRIKRPPFSFNDDFRCDVFGNTFNFIVAQSILTHCGVDRTRILLLEMSAVLAKDGLVAFSIIESNADDEMPAEAGWTYPHCVSYGKSALADLCAEANLRCTRIPWYHPGATWYVAARDAQLLPSDYEKQFLRGAVLFDADFSASRST
jgi:SAM-dependent methyltransferase